MFQLLKSSVVPLTPEFAKEFRNLPASPTERDIVPARLRYLRRQADGGRLVTFHWAKAQYQGAWVRMNGQHSSTMLCELDGGFPSGLSVHLDEYATETDQDLAELFRQFDHRGSSRSKADVAGAYQGLVGELRDVDKKIAKLGIEGVTWYRRNYVDMPGQSGDDQYNLFQQVELHDYLHWLNGILSENKTRELLKVSVIAAMHGTFMKNEEAAREFWADVARGGIDENSPAMVLDDWLEEIKKEKLDIKEGEYFRGCIYAWNAYREERSIKEIRFDKRKAAQAISD